jgi:hypothetical protein
VWVLTFFQIDFQTKYEILPSPCLHNYGQTIVDITPPPPPKTQQTYREEVSGAHGEELDEGLHSKDGGEEVVAIQQKRIEKWRPK